MAASWQQISVIYMPTSPNLLISDRSCKSSKNLFWINFMVKLVAMQTKYFRLLLSQPAILDFGLFPHVPHMCPTCGAHAETSRKKNPHFRVVSACAPHVGDMRKQAEKFWKSFNLAKTPPNRLLMTRHLLGLRILENFRLVSHNTP